MTRWRRLLDRTFEIAIVLKALDGLLEVIGGVALLAVSPTALHSLAVWATRAQLARHPHDGLSLGLLRWTADLGHTRTFGAIYLLSHGVVKIVLVAALLLKQRWAYPGMLVFLVGFIVYQCDRMTYRPSVGLALLTVFDVFVVGLTWREWKLGGPIEERRRSFSRTS